MLLTTTFNFYYALGLALLGILFGARTMVTYLVIGGIIFYVYINQDATAVLIFLLFFMFGARIHELYNEYYETKDKCRIVATLDKGMSPEMINNINFNQWIPLLYKSCNSA